MGSKKTPIGWMGCESTHHPLTSHPQGGNPENLVAAPAVGETLCFDQQMRKRMQLGDLQTLLLFRKGKKKVDNSSKAIVTSPG